MTIKKNINIDEIAHMLCQMWGPLSEEQSVILKSHIRVALFKKNEIIFRENETPAMMKCLINGKVKVYKDGVGHHQIIRAIKPVEFFGFRAYFAHDSYRTSAMALEPSTIAILPLHVVEQLMAENPHIAIYLMRQLASLLGDSDRRTVNLTQKHIRGRLAEALIFLKDNYGLEEDGYTLSIYLSREDLASLSNMTTSNAIRTLSAFAAERLIAIDGRKIKIIQEEELRKISSMG